MGNRYIFTLIDGLLAYGVLICSLAQFDRHDAIPSETVHRMMESLRHHRPDEEGIYVAARIGLGHRRLSIIDVACGHQPISNEDKTVWVLLNGEIYNYPELSRELLGHGHKFTTSSDMEVIVHLYERFGALAGCAACFRSRCGTLATASWSSFTIVWARNHCSTSAALGRYSRDRCETVTPPAARPQPRRILVRR